MNQEVKGEKGDQVYESPTLSSVSTESPRPALERCPYCHTAYVLDSDEVCPKAPALEREIKPFWAKGQRD